MKKILFVETTNASPHLETALELAKNHIENGDIVYFYFVGNSVSFSEFTYSRWLSKFFLTSPQKKGAKLLDSSSFFFYEPLMNEIMIDFKIPMFETLEELKAYSYKSFKGGLSTSSSLISFIENSNPHLGTYYKLVSKILLSGISIYEYTLKLISKHEPDLIYFFNGRFANNRAILDAALVTNTPFLIHERGADMFKYSVRPFMPHDAEKIEKEIIEYWNQNNENKELIGSQFFEKRRIGVEQGWVSFVKGQNIGEGINAIEGKKLISYFSSSDDEYAAVGDIYKWERWPSQLDAVHSLLEIIRRNPDLFLVIRLHPHMAVKDKSDLKVWLDLPIPENAKLILPEATIDTYKLIEQSSIVITSGSTVGIEAVYWGKPSVCLGPSIYSKLNAVYLPNNSEELERIILDYNLNVDKISSLPYGYYMSSFGINYKYYIPKTLFEGKFLNVNLAYSGFLYNKIFRKASNLYKHIRVGIKKIIV
jgi:hypothetical protein